MTHWLLVILSVMTWTVESKNTVTLVDGGTVPHDIEVSYANTYNKGQVRAGDVATLTLGNMGGITVERVSLAMRANAKSGSGTITVTADEQSLAQKTVTWQSVSDDVELFKGQKHGVETMTVRVTGTENSVYVDAFTIEWSPRASQHVILMRGSTPVDTLTEEHGMDGVLLPTLQNEAHWRFTGWSKKEFWTVYDEPAYHPANSRYYPENDTLWAVYQWEEVNTGERIYETEVTSGVYMYVDRETQMALTGVPVEGTMERATANIYDANQHYELAFADDNTVNITHVPTGTPIGYHGKQMAAKATPWNVYHQGDQTLFYTTIDSKTYVLWLNIMEGGGNETHAGLLLANPGNSPMGLLGTMMPTEIYAFTCHPEAMVGIEDVPDEGMSGSGNERTVQVGIYELHIRNGKKYIKLKE